MTGLPRYENAEGLERVPPITWRLAGLVPAAEHRVLPESTSAVENSSLIVAGAGHFIPIIFSRIFPVRGRGVSGPFRFMLGIACRSLPNKLNLASIWGRASNEGFRTELPCRCRAGNSGNDLGYLSPPVPVSIGSGEIGPLDSMLRAVCRRAANPAIWLDRQFRNSPDRRQLERAGVEIVSRASAPDQVR
jgi:hypothetical protein